MKVEHHNLKGILVALSILFCWIGNLAFLIFYFKIESYSHYPLLALQSFLNIGLFITAHDAMHGTLSPDYPKFNQGLGTLCLLLYAGFSFKKLKSQHILHHRFPATEQDPDFARNHNERLFNWFFHFIKNYFGLKEFIFMTIMVTFVTLMSGSLLKMLLIYALPSMTSALQIFYFGTYLPHRTPPEGHTHPDRAISNSYSTWVSFLTCYHFGYHQEHHETPAVPWWKLPEVYQNKLRSSH